MRKHYYETSKILSRIFGTKFFLLAPVLFLLSLTSCDRSSVVGLEVQPEGDLLNVGFQDTTTLITRTQHEDSLRTDALLIATGNPVLGKYIDPIFGEATASLYTQVRLPSNLSASSFGDNPVCDSIVLSLVYSGLIYGGPYKLVDLESKQRINVYQLDDKLSASAIYYSDTTLAHSSDELANLIFKPELDNKVYAEGTVLSPRLRIKLDRNFGQTIINNRLTGNLSTNEAFQAFMKGLYITTENTTGLSAGHGNIFSIKMSESKVTLFYENIGKNNAHPKYSKYDLTLDNVARINHFNHNYSLAEANLKTQLDNSVPENNYSTVYVQAMAGLKTKVSMPYLMNWVKAGPISINKAELVVKTDKSTMTYGGIDSFPPPRILIVFGIYDDGTIYVLPDLLESPYYFNGVYDESRGEYRLNISRYIQQVLDGKRKNNGLCIAVPHITAATSANRVVLGGGASGSPLQMKLNITYTKLH